MTAGAGEGRARMVESRGRLGIAVCSNAAKVLATPAAAAAAIGEPFVREDAVWPRR